MTSALLLGMTGISLTFLPAEILHYYHLETANNLILQIPGALYLGFAMLNWTAKGNLIGGIYSRPVSIANFTHFFVGGITLIKLLLINSSSTSLLIAAIIYMTYAILFGYITFFTSARKKMN